MPNNWSDWITNCAFGLPCWRMAANSDLSRNREKWNWKDNNAHDHVFFKFCRAFPSTRIKWIHRFLEHIHCDLHKYLRQLSAIPLYWDFIEKISIVFDTKVKNFAYKSILVHVCTSFVCVHRQICCQCRNRHRERKRKSDFKQQ